MTMHAEWTWLDGEFRRNVKIAINEDGRFGPIDRAATTSPTHPRTALLPGFVNAHSHAFQRGLRGQGEQFPADAENFWTWREAMYGLVAGLTAESLLELSRSAFNEMRRAGITTVGEFHYLHHLQAEDRFAGDRVVLQAARESGIRIVLLSAHYTHGGFGESLSGGQLQFDTTDASTYWSAFDAAAAACGPNQSMGVVAHSLRAVPIDDLAELHAEAVRRGHVLHIHVEEQQREIDECVAATGRTPTRLLLEQLDPGPECTSVHATHTSGEDLEAWLARGCGICLCPLTEANLGDGFPDRAGMLHHAGSLAIGSDSNARISMLEELRMLELAHRLHDGSRGAWRDGTGRIDRVLLDMATIGGATSLGIDAGRIAEGALADLVLVDLDSDTLAHVDPEHLGAALLLGSDREAIIDTCVGGVWSKA